MSDIAREMTTVVVERLGKPPVEADLWRPAGQLAKPAVGGDEIADVDLFALYGEFAPFEFAGSIRADQGLGKRQQGVGGLAPDIERLPGGITGECRDQERLGRIVDIQQLATLLAAPYLETLVFQRPAEPDPEKVLPRVLDAHPRPVN